MHLVRLFKMVAEVLSTGQLLVRRPDAEWVLGIRDGELSDHSPVTLAESMTQTLCTSMDASALPERPDEDAAEALLIELHADSLSTRGSIPSLNHPSTNVARVTPCFDTDHLAWRAPDLD